MTSGQGITSSLQRGITSSELTRERERGGDTEKDRERDRERSYTHRGKEGGREKTETQNGPGMHAVQEVAVLPCRGKTEVRVSELHE